MAYKTFAEFYPHYLKQHSHIMCRRMHFLGTCAAIALSLLFFFTGNLVILGLIPLIGYGLAWSGHFMFQNNHPLSLRYPIYSMGGDFKMFWDILRGRVKAF